MDLFAFPDMPVPPGGHVQTITTVDRIAIRTARWRPSFDPARPQTLGTVVLLHGRTEFIEKYAEVIGDLLRRGFAVATFDWRGQGGSQRLLKDRQRGFIEDFADYDRDLEAFVRLVLLPDCPPPFTMLAHSTGGNIWLRNEPTLQGRFSRAILTAPLIGLGAVGASPALVRAVALGFESIGLGDQFVIGSNNRPISEIPFEGNLLTGDPERYRCITGLYRAATQLSISGPTWSWVLAACRSMDLVADPVRANANRTPTLIIASGDDRVVSRPAIERLVPHLRLARQITVPGARHEIMFESEALRAQFWAIFDAFIPGEAGSPTVTEPVSLTPG